MCNFSFEKQYVLFWFLWDIPAESTYSLAYIYCILAICHDSTIYIWYIHFFKAY